MSDMHVYPLDDLKEHDTSGTDCHCNPRIEVIGGSLLIIHNAYDHREIIEEANEILEEYRNEEK